jgi:hypothetical protein
VSEQHTYKGYVFTDETSRTEDEGYRGGPFGSWTRRAVLGGSGSGGVASGPFERSARPTHDPLGLVDPVARKLRLPRSPTAFPLRSSQAEQCCWFGRVSLASRSLPEAHDVQSVRPQRQIPLDRDPGRWEQVDRSRVFDVSCGRRRSPRRSRHRRGQGSQTCMGARSVARFPHRSTRGVAEAIDPTSARYSGVSLLAMLSDRFPGSSQARELAVRGSRSCRGSQSLLIGSKILLIPPHLGFLLITWHVGGVIEAPYVRHDYLPRLLTS